MKKKGFILTTIFLAVMTVLLLISKAQGLHPNFIAFAFMVPAAYALVWAKITLSKLLK